jgi:DNA anti-recombination protein RmuC
MPRQFHLVLLSLGLALTGAAWAQQGTPTTAPTAKHLHAIDPQQQLDRLTKQLQLTSDQQAKILPLLQQRDQQLQSLRDDSSLKPADRRTKAMSIMQDTNQQVDAVLTEPQRVKAKAMREKAMERMEERRGQHMPASSSSSGAHP